MSETSSSIPPRDYADPPRVPTSPSSAEREYLGRLRRKEVGFAEALASVTPDRGGETDSPGPTGIDVWLVGEAGVASLMPVDGSGESSILDFTNVDDALPGPWELDVVALARHVAKNDGGRVVPDMAEGYRRAVTSLAHAPLHARTERAVALATRSTRDALGASAEAALERLVKSGDEPLLRRDRVAKRWDAPVVDAEGVERELAHYRETVAEPVAALISHYSVADAVSDESGRLLVLLARQADDVILLEAIPAGPTPLEESVGAWRHGSDLQRVLLVRESLPLVPPEMLGWTTSPEGNVARAWARARALPKGAKVDLGGRRRRARAYGTVLGLLHARSGDAAMLAGYLGLTPKFGAALAAAVKHS